MTDDEKSKRFAALGAGPTEIEAAHPIWLITDEAQPPRLEGAVIYKARHHGRVGPAYSLLASLLPLADQGPFYQSIPSVAWLGPPPGEEERRRNAIDALRRDRAEAKRARKKQARVHRLLAALERQVEDNRRAARFRIDEELEARWRELEPRLPNPRTNT